MSKETDLSLLRVQIDQVDAQLLALVNERAKLAQAVGEVKKTTQAPVYRPEREAQIHQALAQQNPGPLSAASVQAIWSELISGCRELERRLRVAYLGPRGTFSEQAAIRHYGQQIDGVPQASIDDVFRAVEIGEADFGVVPVENSSEGSIGRTLDLMLDSSLCISGEVALPVTHNLLTQSGTMQGVTKICAHQQALGQCHQTLNKLYPGIERLAVSSNAEGARLASLDASIAGIAAVQAAQEFNLGIAQRAVQDDAHNRTRFFLMGKWVCGASGRDTTSLILSVPNKAGAVHSLIEPLARHAVSMTRFESRPARRDGWEYFFHIDVSGHQSDPQVAAALAEISQQAAFFKITGSYPKSRDV
jgi:chorismate mutase / prephenate dehydratase